MHWDEGDLRIGAMPLWAQIADRLRSSIEDNSFPEGTKLPSESEIVARFGVSRATARKALDQLASEDLVVRRSGIGTTVLFRQVEQSLNLLSSFQEDMLARGFAPSYRGISVSVISTNQRVAEALDIETGSRVIRIERLLLADGAVIAHSISWLSPNFVEPSELSAAENSGSGSLYAWLEKAHHVKITQGTEIIEAKVADANLAKQLEIPLGSAVLDAQRIARATDGRAIEFVQRQYRADRYRYRIELVRP